MKVWSRRRADRLELLDAPRHDPDELRAALGAVARVNRWFGGTAAVRSHLRELRDRKEDLSILDVGTGDGQMLLELVRWGQARGGEWRGIGLDLHAQVARIAARNLETISGLGIVRGDALALPFADDAFDVVLSTLTLHHLEHSRAVKAVAEMARVARRRLLVNDLHRHPVNYALAALLSWTLWRGDRLTRHDGPVSVLRSFTPGELREVGREAGLGMPRVRRHFPYRIVLEGRP